VSVPASPTLRWVTAALLFAAAGLSIVVPFVSATLLTIAIGAVAVIAGVSQVLRLTGEADLKGKIFRLLSGLLYFGGGIWVLAFPVESEVSLTLFVGFRVFCWPLKASWNWPPRPPAPVLPAAWC